MKKVLLLLLVVVFGTNVYAATRIVRTYSPIPYNRRISPFVRTYPASQYNLLHHSYHNYNNYYNPARNYYPSRYRIINNSRRVINPVYRNNYSMPTGIDRFRSYSQSAYVPISYNSNSADNRVSLVEKNIFGKSYEHQGMSLRLNRLEKSMFNRTFPTMSYEDRIDNLLINYNKEFHQVSPKMLNKLERSVFKRTYESDSECDRISRLEEQVLGAIQQGNLEDRINLLNEAIEGKSFTPPVQSSYGTCYGGYVPQVPYNSGWKNFLSSVGMIFGAGYPTGMTPSISPYDSAHFGLEDGGNSEGYVSNYGYAYRNSHSGTGSGIQILD